MSSLQAERGMRKTIFRTMSAVSVVLLLDFSDASQSVLKQLILHTEIPRSLTHAKCTGLVKPMTLSLSLTLHQLVVNLLTAVRGTTTKLCGNIRPYLKPYQQ